MAKHKSCRSGVKGKQKKTNLVEFLPQIEDG